MLLAIYPQALSQVTALTASASRIKQISAPDGTKKPLVFSFNENALTYSNDFTNLTAWSQTTASAVISTQRSTMDVAYGGAVFCNNLSTTFTSLDTAYGGATINANYGNAITAGTFYTDPQGGTTAAQINFGYIRQPITITAGSVYTVSVWVKAASISPATSIRITTNDTSSWNTGYSTVFSVPNTWTRIVYTGLLNSTSSTNANIYIGDIDVGGNVDSTCLGNVLVWEMQVNLGRYPASITDTTSAGYARNNPAVRERHDVEGAPVTIDTTTKRLRAIKDTETITY